LSSFLTTLGSQFVVRGRTITAVRQQGEKFAVLPMQY
jgi:hypothetical protein